ncbi:hypothetical protein KIW84_032359 [Lathyrus oleraceus]|uniref:Uncharacterized protein n=1 Tax=Pisum sativum TaxID=3888 RepID=A0A9D4XXA3_PEA|nr:hypothetical protein KIW84_032359 [Pisum sativum]
MKARAHQLRSELKTIKKAPPKAHAQESTSTFGTARDRSKPQESTFTEATAYLAHQDIVRVPQELESQAWFANSVSKFAKDNDVYFEFDANKCCVKSQASNVLVLEGFLDESGLYCFNKLGLEFSKDTLSHKSLLPIVNNIVVSTALADNVDVNVVPKKKTSL